MPETQSFYELGLLYRLFIFTIQHMNQFSHQNRVEADYTCKFHQYKYTVASPPALSSAISQQALGTGKVTRNILQTAYKQGGEVTSTKSLNSTSKIDFVLCHIAGSFFA
jgi:hypothetical protein